MYGKREWTSRGEKWKEKVRDTVEGKEGVRES